MVELARQLPILEQCCSSDEEQKDQAEDAELSLALIAIGATTPEMQALALPDNTALPVTFVHTINAAEVKAGDAVTVKTAEVVLLPNGEQLAAGTHLTGHIVEAQLFKFDDTPYAMQQASYLAIQFDAIVDKGVSRPVVANVRALADYGVTHDALTPQGMDESDSRGTMVLVGGAHYSPTDSRVRAGDEDDVVAYNKSQGVFARLLPAQYLGNGSGFSCSGTQTEQSVGIFSPDACGLYGFSSVSLSESNGGLLYFDHSIRH